MKTIHEASFEERQRAPDGYVWVCSACGKRARDAYGNDGPREWDVSCYLNSLLVEQERVVIDKDGRAVRILP